MSRESNVLLLGMSYPEVTPLDGIGRSPDISITMFSLQRIVAYIKIQVELNKMTQIDGRDYIRIKAMELFEANKCYTVSLVDNKDQRYNSLFHTRMDFNAPGLVDVLKLKLKGNQCSSFKDIYIDYFWMANSKDRFKKGLFEYVIPSFGSSTILEEGGTICIPICINNLQWITRLEDKYKKLYEIQFITNEEHQMCNHKLWSSTQRIDKNVMLKVFGKTCNQEDQYCIINNKILRQSEYIDGTTETMVKNFLAKYFDHSDLNQIRFICLVKKTTISTPENMNDLIRNETTDIESDLQDSNVAQSEKDTNKFRAQSTINSFNTNYDKVNNDKPFILIPRKNNTRHSSDFAFSDWQTEYYSKNFLDKMTVEKYLVLSSIEARKQFCQHLIQSHLSDQIEVKKFDEETKTYCIMSTNDVYNHIRTAYETKKRKRTMKEKKKKEMSDLRLIGSTNESVQPLNDPISKDNNPVLNINRYALLYKWKDNNHNLWTRYSMMHNLFESFNLIVYNCSHKVPKTEIVHYHTRSTIKFPADKNFMILFHGLLLHSGAASKRENYWSSFNYAMDLRLFAYIQLHPKDAEQSQYIRRSTDGYSTRDVDASLPSDTNVCPAFRGQECLHCNVQYSNFDKNHTHNKAYEDAHTIDVLSEYTEKLRNNKTKRNKSSGPLLVCGNIEQYGWAVYTGIDVGNRSCDNNMLKNDLLSLLYSKGMLSKWRFIQGSKTNGRMSLKLDDVSMISSHRDKMKTLSSFLEKEILEKQVMSIAGFETAQFMGRYILSNKGNIEEQDPHCDFAKSHL